MAKKIEFDKRAVILTVLENAELLSSVSVEFNISDNLLEAMAENQELMNGKMSNKLRSILRNNIEKNAELLNSYTSKLSDNSTDNREFAIKIVGAGTKAGIILELEAYIFQIKCSSIEKLRNGVEVEHPNTILKTDVSEAYTGYDY